MITVVVRAIIECKGQYLLVKIQGEDFWCLPGGKVEPNEAILDALSRELVEELNVKPQIGELLFVQQLFKDQKQRLEFFFSVTNGQDYASADFKQASNADELSAVEFKDMSTETDVLPRFLQTDLLKPSAAQPAFKVSRVS